MPKWKQNSSPNRKLKFKAQPLRTYENKVRDLEKHIKKHTDKVPIVTPEGRYTGDFEWICRDICAVEALKRLKAAGTWKK